MAGIDLSQTSSGERGGGGAEAADFETRRLTEAKSDSEELIIADWASGHKGQCRVGATLANGRCHLKRAGIARCSL